MDCRRCAEPLDRPGDYCLVCNTANADAVVIDADRERATLTMLDEDAVVGSSVVRTTEEDGENAIKELRAFAGQIADELHRKRPETVYAAGDRQVLREIQGESQYELLRVTGDDPVETAIDRRGERSLDVVDAAPAEKIGGSHSTLIGGREGMRAIRTVAGHPHVKKVIPGPIDAGGTGSQSGLRAKATRADAGGNVRLLLRDGSSVQENRVVTTAREADAGELIREDLNAALDEADLY
ncbi:hypothetical protein L593_02940 [Salinarchaeum sp. Harcht-Bsk1]|uniref:DUF2103 domain-containing protein n=1 Tax=Salinarchaeum sp. Harcht-Bsk1 TaxID=1333523 RepID=UPI0003422910|nr:DUF2103 domain-containing protein [Salinarchaeum sp. Harcht-Bsk1]AGN00539.1 hypothetical protein L593_02940 [Salinarchaeum sp. Harcht-Bsk1]